MSIKALKPTAQPLRGFASAELGRWPHGEKVSGRVIFHYSEKVNLGKGGTVIMGSTFFLKKVLHYFCPVLAIISSIAITGCTTVHKNFKPFSPTPGQHEKVAAKVAIVLTDELCSFYYKPRDFQEFSLGPVLCANIRNGAKAAFTQPLFFSKTEDALLAQADFIGVLRPGVAYLYGTREIPVTVLTYVSVSWEVLSRDGKRLYGATIYGDGRDQRTFGMSDVRYESSMQQCLNNLTANLYKEMTLAPQRADNNAVVSSRIGETLKHFQAGRTTYAQYLESKDSEWHIFSLEDRVKYGGEGVSYLYDPASNTHMSLIGAWPHHGLRPLFSRSEFYRAQKNYFSLVPRPWGTKWGLRLHIIKSLRPSVYLPEIKIDHSRIDSIYIRELVGSLYDDHPLCELVFEGKSLDTLVLTEFSCQKEFLSTGAYLSVDAYDNRDLDKTAQKWVKLRPGMSPAEVAGIIDAPVSGGRIIGSPFGARVVYIEYGGGLVHFHEDGLSHWLLE